MSVPASIASATKRPAARHAGDRFMVPLASFLRLKTSVDVEPGTAEDRALLLVDQGKQAADPFLRRTLLSRAAQQLDIAVREEAEEALLARLAPPRAYEKPSRVQPGSPRLCLLPPTKPSSLSTEPVLIEPKRPFPRHKVEPRPTFSV